MLDASEFSIVQIQLANLQKGTIRGVSIAAI
jgi:hypothetical protein